MEIRRKNQQRDSTGGHRLRRLPRDAGGDRGGSRVVHPDRRRRRRHPSRRRRPSARHPAPAGPHAGRQRPGTPVGEDAMEARGVRAGDAPRARHVARLSLLLDRERGAARVRAARGRAGPIPALQTRRVALRGWPEWRGMDRGVRRAKDGSAVPVQRGRIHPQRPRRAVRIPRRNRGVRCAG